MSHADVREPRQSRVMRLIAEIVPAQRADEAAVRAHLDELTKPPGSLGRLETLAVRLARIYGDPPPPLRRRVVLVFAADHGVANRGVSAYPQDVTAQMCRTFAAGGAAICALGRASDAEVLAVDVGVLNDAEPLGILSRRVRAGTADLSTGAAMTREEALRAIAVGVDLVAERAEDVDVFALGEMGIGNTTAAAALTAALTGVPAVDVVGSGTGIDAARLAHKRRIVAEAVARIPGGADPIDILAEVGGLEIAALTGAALACARAGRAFVIDGFISTAAALVAARLAPSVVDYAVASHRSAEPGHGVQLAALGLDPLLNLELRLGEGTGAVLVLTILECASAMLREMATFSGAGVSRAEEPRHG